MDQDGTGVRAIGWCPLETHYDAYPARTMTSGTDGFVTIADGGRIVNLSSGLARFTLPEERLFGER
jgi:hypothetical protein